MNLELFGAILAYIGLFWTGFIIFVTLLYYFRNLSDIGRRFSTIKLGKEIIIFVISVVYLIVYYIS